jgi:hypothetical protein
MAKVFLSYAPSDAGSVHQIAGAIEAAGHIVKLGRASIDVVDTGGRSIARAERAPQHVVASAALADASLAASYRQLSLKSF